MNNKIKLIYEGNGRLEIQNNQIHFENEIGEIQEGKLFCYQGSESNEINSSYIINKNIESTVGSQTPEVRHPSSDIFSYEIGIQLNNYDKSKELIIDPQLVWSTFYGGNLPDGAPCIDTDSNGNVFVVGYTSSNTGFPLNTGVGGAYYQGATAGLISDAFVLKFSNNGTLIWSTFFGGDADDYGHSLVVTPANEIVVVGSVAISQTASTNANFPYVNPGAGAYFQNIFGGGAAGNSDIFILKFSNNGVLTWSTLYGGSGDESESSVCSDANGNIFVTGKTNSINFPLTNPGGGAYFSGALTGNYDGFVLKFDSNANILWSTYFGGTSLDQGHAICSDINGNIFITGTTYSNNFPTQNFAGAYNQAATGGGVTDAFLMKFDNSGILAWSTYYGGGSYDYGYSICNDLNGNVFVTGLTSSNNFPILNSLGTSFFQPTYAGGTALYGDAYILKFNNNGVRQWATYYGGSADELSFASYDNIATDNCGNVYVSFETQSTNIPFKQSCDNGFIDSTLTGIKDIFITQFANDGTLLWATYLGGSGDDFREALATDANNNLFIAGEWTKVTNNNSYPLVNPGGGVYFDNSFNGNPTFDHDACFLKFTVPILSLSYTTVPAICVCKGVATVTATGGCAPYNYIWSNGVNHPNVVSNTDSIVNLCPGSYWVIVNSKECSQNTDTVFFTIAGGVGGNITTTQNPIICTGQSYPLPGGGIATIAGTYNDTIALTNGCDSIIITNLSVVSVINNIQNPTICQGQNYTMPDNSIATASTIYIDTLTSSGGCDSVITVNLTVTPAFTVTQTPAICTGQNFTLPDGSIVNTSGTYIDTVTSIGGCDSIVTTVLTVSAALTSSQNPILCTGNSFLLPDGTTVTAAGVYVDTLTSSGGCDSIITTTLAIKPNSTGTQSYTMCSGNSYTLPGGIIVTTSGTYYDTVLSANGCDSIITTTVTVNPSPAITVSPNVSIAQGDSTTLLASGGGTYNWIPTTGLNTTSGATVIARPNQTTIYCVEVTTANGCKDTACVTVTIETPCPNSEELGVPNAFSPNNDGINDEFCLQGWDSCIENFNIIIYNRWGEKVYESKDPNFCWDGKLLGTTYDAQVFVYHIKATYLNIDKAIIKKGNISLIR